MTTVAKKKKGEKKEGGDNAVQYRGMAFMNLMNRRGGTGLGGEIQGPLLADEHLKDFPTSVYRFGGPRRQHRFNVYDWLSRSV